MSGLHITCHLRHLLRLLVVRKVVDVKAGAGREKAGSGTEAATVAEVAGAAEAAGAGTAVAGAAGAATAIGAVAAVVETAVGAVPEVVGGLVVAHLLEYWNDLCASRGNIA